jgi:hypothetical protein
VTAGDFNRDVFLLPARQVNSRDQTVVPLEDVDLRGPGGGFGRREPAKGRSTERRPVFERPIELGRHLPQQRKWVVGAAGGDERGLFFFGLRSSCSISRCPVVALAKPDRDLLEKLPFGEEIFVRDLHSSSMGPAGSGDTVTWMHS